MSESFLQVEDKILPLLKQKSNAFCGGRMSLGLFHIFVFRLCFEVHT